MPTKDEILRRLIQGEDAQVIAEHMAKALNDALADYREIKQAKEEKARKEKEKAERKEDAKVALAQFMKFYNKWFDDGDEVDGIELDAAADLLLAMFDMPLDETEVKVPVDKNRKVTIKRTDDDVLRDFLSKL